MHFRLSFVVRGLFLSEGESLEFALGGDRQAMVMLRDPTGAEVEAGHGKHDAMGTASLVVEPLQETIRAGFASLADRRLPDGHKEWDPRVYDYIRLDADGRLEGNIVPPPELLPDALGKFIRSISGDLWSYARRVVFLIRWRLDRVGPHNPFGFRGSQFSLDGRSWHTLPGDIRIRFLGAIAGLRESPELRAEVERLARDGESEPLARQLYLEAWEQRTENPRSALVIGMAAAEVGFKQFVSWAAPSTQWLMENIQSPPLVPMLKRYLPLLPARLTFDGRVLPPPRNVRDSLDKGVKLRNRLAHVGPAEFSDEQLDEILQAVADLLWILDYYRGHAWALEHVREATRVALQRMGEGQD